MIWEISFAVIFAVMVYRIIKVFRDAYAGPDRTTSVPTAMRELGLLELFCERNYKVNNYFLSTLIVVDSIASIDNSKIEEALEILAKRHPFLQAVIKEVDFPNGKRYYFTAMPTFKVEYQQSEKLATDPNHWRDAMSQDLLVPFNDREGPLWRCCRLKECIDSQSGHVTNAFVFAFHHSIIDGRSRIMFFDEFLGILDKLHKNVTVENMQYNLAPSCETVLEKMRPEWWRRIKMMFVEMILKMGLTSLKSNRIDAYFNKYPVVSNINPAVKPDNNAILTYFSKAETEILVRTCKKNGCTVHGAITAAANMAMADILQNGHVTNPQCIRSSCAITCRRDIKFRESDNFDYLGIYSVENEIDCYVPPYDSQSFSNVSWKVSNEVTRHLQKTVKTYKHLEENKDTQCLSQSVFESLIHSRTWKHHGRRYGSRLFLISNVGRFDEVPGRMFRLKNMFLMDSGYKEWNLFDIFVATVNGTLCFTFVYFPHITAKGQAEEFNSKFVLNLKRMSNIT